MNQCLPGPQVFHWGRFEFFRKFGTGDTGDTGDKLFSGVNDTGENLWPVSMKPAINPCHGEIIKSLIFSAGVNDTTEKLFNGVNDTADKLFGGVNDNCD
jgi:hypothetical protein